MKINISGVFTPSPKQIAAGIYGAASVEVVSDDGFVIARLSGITVRESKTGSKFLSMPSFKISGKDGDKWLKHFNLFPLAEDADYNNAQKESMSKFTNEILRLLEEKSSGNNQPVPTKTITTADAEPWG
mgnify:CR=1 FL=1